VRPQAAQDAWGNVNLPNSRGITFIL